MALPLFRDPSVQEQFEREGFVILPVLGEAEVSRLLEFYQTLDRGDVSTPPFHYSMDHPDLGYVQQVMDEIIEVLGSAVEPHIHNMQVITASFVVKESHPKGVVPPHQDWTFVDEERFRSATVWTPLMDVDVNNGALGVIHGSHRYFGNQLRSSPAPQCKSMLSDHLFKIFPFLDIKNMKAGEALIFDNATIHGSPPNVSDEVRVAAGLGITRSEAALQHNFLLPGTESAELETYEVDRKFFMQFGNDELSKLFDAGSSPAAKGAKVIGRKPYVLDPIAEPDLMSLVQAHPENRFNADLVQKLQAIFSSGGEAAAVEETEAPGDDDGQPEPTVTAPPQAVLPAPGMAQRLRSIARRMLGALGGGGNGRAAGSNSGPVSPMGAGNAFDSLKHPDADNPNAADAVGSFYDEHHDAFLEVYGNVIQAFRTKDVAELLDYQADSMDLKAGQRALDAGCGVAGPAIHFARERGVEVDALTVSANQAAEAERRIEDAGLTGRVRVQRGDYHTLSDLFPADTFDVIYMLESFGHSFDKPRLLDECLKVLKPGGMLYVKDLFQREPVVPAHAEPIRRELEKINVAYHYEVADLYDILRHVRKTGWILGSLKTIDLELEKFENLTISNDFQELTGIAKINNWAEYIFPVEFYEMKCYKPWYTLGSGDSRYFLQNLYHMQVLGTKKEDL